MTDYSGGGAGGLASSITIGTSVITGGSDGDILYNNGGVLGGFQLYDDSGAGDGSFALRKSITGTATTSNFLSVTATLPAVLTASTYGAKVDITPAGSSVQDRVAVGAILNSGQTAGGDSAAIYGLGIGANANNRVVGVWGAGNSSAATSCAGVIGNVNGGTNQAAGFFVLGGAASDANPLSLTLDTYVSGVVALAASNGAVASDIFRLYDNTTIKVQVLDGGHMALSNMSQTAAAMAVETDSQVRTTIHSFTWTNAQVAALGAVTAGDITVCTLPAKTQVRNCYVVITGAAVGPTTVTVSVGDAVGGTPFINYIVASDAKAAANTVYGDAAAERGTSMDVEFYNLPSYTGTTLVTAHFISTGANLSTVTGSTGRIILETVLLP